VFLFSVDSCQQFRKSDAVCAHLRQRSLGELDVAHSAVKRIGLAQDDISFDERIHITEGGRCRHGGCYAEARNRNSPLFNVREIQFQQNIPNGVCKEVGIEKFLSQSPPTNHALHDCSFT